MIYVVRNTLNGAAVRAFRNLQKASDYRAFCDLVPEWQVHEVDEVELDEEPPAPEVGDPYSVRMTMTVGVHARLGEVLGAGEALVGSGGAQAKEWAVAAIAGALGDAFQGVEKVVLEVLDEQGRRVDG